MSTEENVQIVKDFFAAMGSSNARDLLALAAEDIEWIIPGQGWPLAGTHRGHAELAAVLKKASEHLETQYPKPPEFVAQGDRVMVVGVATGKIKATNRPFKDEWVFDITVRHGKVARIQEFLFGAHRISPFSLGANSDGREAAVDGQLHPIHEARIV